MRRIFTTRPFDRWMKKSALTDVDLCRAVKEMSEGLIDAVLGGGLLKKRIAFPGRGKRGSARTIVATNLGDRWFFIYGFEKSEAGNINAVELKALKALADDLLALEAGQLEKSTSSKALREIRDETR